MEQTCTMIEMKDGTRQIQYSKEEIAPNIFVRESWYVRLPSDKIEEIRNAKSEEVQKILSRIK